MRVNTVPRAWHLPALALMVAFALALGVGSSGRAAGPWSAQGLQPAGSASPVKDDFSRAGMTGPQREFVVIIKLDEQSLSSYSGGVPGLAPTSPAALGKAKLELNSPASQAYLAYLRQKHQQFAAALELAVPGATVLYDLTTVIGGVVASVPPDSLKQVERLQGVQLVLPDAMEHLNAIDPVPAFVGAPTVWNQLGGQESAGDGVIVGVLDTGIWPEHPSLSDPDPSGKPYSVPPPAPDGSRRCDFTGGSNPGPAFSCNNKLIGAQRFMASYDAIVGLLPDEFTTARDDDGHGTHTTTTAAGNSQVDASYDGRYLATISGIAPRAHVMSYKVCGEQGCFQSDSVAAIQEAIDDGVDVINFSISGGKSPFADAVELAFLDAYNAGVFVAASAGNSGPTADTTDHRGPWVTTVAASTSNRQFQSALTLSATGGATLRLVGSSVTRGVASDTPVVIPTSDPACLGPFAPGSLAGKLVVCQRLGGARILKSFAVEAGGAVGMILVNSDAASQGLDEFTDNHYVPSVHLSFSEGQSLLTFLSGHTGVVGRFDQSAPGPDQGDRITAFSSRGGPGQTLGVSKPDLTAPGIQILAGNTGAGATPLSGPDGELFQAIAGTSMSSPHVAGVGALLKALHPDWTPGQIKSALMTSANRSVTNETGTAPATPFDTGSGRIDLNQAGQPGFTIDESAADYVAHQDDLWNANYPSIYVPVLAGSVTLTRTLRSTMGEDRGWNIQARDVPADLKVTTSPQALQLLPGQEKTITITIDAKAVPVGAVRTARIEIKSGNLVRSIPITIVRRNAPVTLTKTCTPDTIFRTGNQTPNTTTCTITAQNSLFSDAPVSIVDNVPNALRVVDGSVVGATQSGNRVEFQGTLGGASPPGVSIAPGDSPGGGYLPLSAFGITPISGMGDETIVNFNVPAFTFAGQTYTRIGIVSDGYAVVGGGTGADVDFVNQHFPDPTQPNNVLAPFWTDLNPTFGGTVRVGTLTDGSDTWIVIDWEGVREFSQPRTASFEIWIGVDGDANPAEDISYAYGTIQGNGDGGFLTVGVENAFGNRGQNVYADGVGTLPSNGTQLRVSSTPALPGAQKVITFSAKAQSKASVVNYVELISSAVAGTVSASFSINIK